MISVQNRLPEPGRENRVSITPDSGSPIEGVLAYADNASQQGTFWNRSTAQLLQGDIRTYPVRDGQSISAGDVVNVGVASDGEADTIYKDVVPQDNVENVVFNVAVTGTDTIKLSDQYSVTALLRSSDGQAALIDNETGKQVGDRTQFSASAGITSVSLARLDDSHFVVQFQVGNGLYAKIGTVSGNSITLGNDRVIDQPLSNTNRNNAILSLSQSFALSIYNSSGIQVKFLTISGNQIPTVSAAYSLPSNTGANYISACKLPDEGGNKRVCICFADTGDSNKGKAVIATIDSSNVVTFGDVVTFDENNSSHIDCCVSNGYIVVAYQQVSSSTNAAIKVISDVGLEIQNSALLYDSSTAANYISISPTENGIAYMQGSVVNGTPQARTVTVPALEIGDNYEFNNAASNYLSSALISENKILLAYADTGNSSYGTTTILTVEGNQIAGSFLDNSSDAIALASGSGGDIIPVGFGGYCQCEGITEGQQITSDGVSAFSPLDGWLSITDARNAVLVTGEYTGTGQSSWSIDVGFKPSALLIQEVGFYSSGGYNISKYIAFIKGSPYGGEFNTTNTTLNVTFTNTGLSFNGYIFNQSGYTYYYVAWR